MGVLSEMDGRALCYPAFSLVVLLRKSYKDGVNRCPPPSVRGTSLGLALVTLPAIGGCQSAMDQVDRGCDRGQAA
jgi:hypothetical protein